MRRDWRVLLIGQAPGRSGGPPCTGRFMEVLIKSAGISQTRYLRAFERTNLLSAWPGSKGGGDAFPADEARRRAAEMDVAGRVVVACGRGVAMAFGVWAAFLRREERRGAVFYVLPHPSGRNRWWNDPENRRLAGLLIRRLAGQGGPVWYIN